MNLYWGVLIAGIVIGFPIGCMFASRVIKRDFGIKMGEDGGI